MNNNSILKVENLTCVFEESDGNEFKAIDNFSYDFKENKIYFIIGNSGSGKSTLVAHFNGLLKSKQGNIYVDNFHISDKSKKIKHTKELRKIISMVFQFPEYQLFKSTIEKDISFGPFTLGIPQQKSKEVNILNLKNTLIQKHWDEIKSSLSINNDYEDFDKFIESEQVIFKYKIHDKKDYANVVLKTKFKKFVKRIEFNTKTTDDYAHELSIKYLTKMGLNETFLDKSPFELSGGQKRRVAIAGILAIEPKILIFDEPTAGLDPQGEHEMMQVILDAKNRGQTIIVITHTMNQVLEIGDEVIVMDEGKIIFSGEPYEVFTNKELYEKTNMEKPNIIELIDNLCEKDKRFVKLYEEKPKTVDQLVIAIKKIVNIK